jgi:pfkB family carbohydrate kinase
LTVPFAAASWPYDKVAQALAYLFKVPEGAAKGMDPGFFKQMAELEAQALAANEHRRRGRQQREPTAANNNNHKKKKVRIRAEEKTTEWAIPHDARIVCAGLACVDMQLNQATGGNGGENIESFEGEISIGGGSVSMACKSLARLCHGAPLDEHLYMQVTPPCVHSVIPLCKVGMDSTGDRLISLLEKCGEACRNVDTKYLKASRMLDPDGRTALAVLPIYKDGRRGCFFDAASNLTFSASEMIGMIRRLSPGGSGPRLDTSTLSDKDIEDYQADLELMTPVYGAFVFGYPHLLPGMQGEALAQVFLEAKTIMIEGGVIALDLNGVPESTMVEVGQIATPDDLLADPVIGASLGLVDIIHMNEDEACLLTGVDIRGTPGFELDDEVSVAKAAELFLECGVAVVIITRGSKGSFVRCNNDERFRHTNTLPASWADCCAKVGCVELPEDAILNGNGAGDSFLAGFLVASMLRHTGMTVPVNEPNVSPKGDLVPANEPSAPSLRVSTKKKLTPYTLYMREHYLSLKTQLNDDKKAIFSRCHEMWENETDDVRSLYERRAFEENEVDSNDNNEMSIAMETLDSTLKVDTALKSSSSEPPTVASPRNLYMTNRSLNLESAVQFASLVAAFHVDTATRDRTHIDVGNLLDRAMIVPSRLEEI